MLLYWVYGWLINTLSFIIFWIKIGRDKNVYFLINGLGRCSNYFVAPSITNGLYSSLELVFKIHKYIHVGTILLSMNYRYIVPYTIKYASVFFNALASKAHFDLIQPHHQRV